ncbi:MULTISPECIES: helix-turn-helix domain-containing protein [Bacillus]|uniref:helix-turn-helix domain-containing protein n=1 Tax=Bacillus TaxID=1386 RepID=UPI000B9B57D4|nr:MULTISPECIES: helix-turn-helix transcriptional regulator [Bacillus]KAB7666926.1 helix-turn-helix transcriptional regulator [Bacillus sp. B1-b2]MCK6205759.1 helix-turn-helix domain-containing protein [Bacillus infantis]OXT17172.1 transcriptional regulator [Bacillus sp. OG2]
MSDLLIGRLIKELRKKKNITMVDFAKRIKISQPSLSKIESGRQEVSFSLLESICHEFGITRSHFFQMLERDSIYHQTSSALNFEEPVDANKEIEHKIGELVSKMTFEQKKALFTFLFSSSKE